MLAETLCSMNSVEDALRGNPSYIRHGLANGGEPWIIECGRFDIVKSNYRNVFRDTQPEVLQGAYCTNRRHVVERYNSSETLTGGEKLLHDGISQFRGREVTIQLYDQFWFD